MTIAGAGGGRERMSQSRPNLGDCKQGRNGSPERK